MPARTTTGPAPPPHDDLDDLFNYDVDPNNVSTDFQPTMDDAPTQLPRSTTTKTRTADLGIDEEIQVVKKRQPIAKLDENRLLSQAGIPKLKRITKERLRFKGKGHEYTDVARLLNLYQLWLDDLYPRAKFADGLAIIEKLGHSKRMQAMRREWIRENQPGAQSTERNITDTVDRQESENMIDAEDVGGATSKGDLSPLDGNGFGSRKENSIERMGEGKRVEESLFISDNEASAPEDDDLDALLAEDAQDVGFRSDGRLEQVRLRNEFEDEEEAMAGMNDMW